MTVKDKKTKECIGECPKCGSHMLDYDDTHDEPAQVRYPFKCQFCGCKGEEVYSVTYIETEYD